MNRKASIFVHWGGAGSNWNNFAGLQNIYEKRIESLIQTNIDSVQDCNDYILPIVFVFIDYATYKYINRSSRGINCNIHTTISEERTLIMNLKKLEKDVRVRLASANPKLKVLIDKYPIFVYIGYNQLASLLNEITRLEPSLLGFLGGGLRTGNMFSYDAPKFFEAVLRIARGNIKNLCKEVILRIDQDVDVFYTGIKELLTKYSKVADYPFHYISGTYGKYDNKTPIDDEDKNNYAVRLQYFYDYNSKPSNPSTQNKDNKMIQTLLADLTELGGKQFFGIMPYPYSSSLQAMISTGTHIKVPDRESAEVISGAGLIASALLLRYIPPFTCVNQDITWIDDHLKRRLVEVLHWIHPSIIHIESIKDAKFQKNRHNGLIAKDDFDWAIKNYLEVLISGCLFHSLITETTTTPNGSKEIPTIYTKKIKEIIETKTLSFPSGEAIFRNELKKILEKKLEIVLNCWSSIEFQGKTSPLDEFYKWVDARKIDNTLKTDLIPKLIEDAMSYLYLVSKWDSFVRAFDRL